MFYLLSINLLGLKDKTSPPLLGREDHTPEMCMLRCTHASIQLIWTLMSEVAIRYWLQRLRCCNIMMIIVNFVTASLLVLLELIAKNGFTPRTGGPSDCNGFLGPRRRQSNNEDTRPEEKPSDNSKPYTADQLDAVRR